MRVIITGHRPKKLPGGYNWSHPYNAEIISWMSMQLRTINLGKGLITACTGMALGIDQMFAHVCWSMDIDFIAFIPCKNQEKVWPIYSQNFYKGLLKKAHKVIYVHDGSYYDGCMQERIAMRDWTLEDKDNTLLAIWNGTPGGTANMIEVCKEKEMKIILRGVV